MDLIIILIVYYLNYLNNFNVLNYINGFNDLNDLNHTSSIMSSTRTFSTLFIYVIMLFRKTSVHFQVHNIFLMI